MAQDLATEVYTNLSINSQAMVQHEIRRQERIHWFLGLRQAELFIQEKESALHANYQLQRKYHRQMEGKQAQLDSLTRESEETQTLQRRHQIEELRDELEAAQRHNTTLQPLLRDCAMELQAAQRERDRILNEHPEAQGLSYLKLQELYSGPAFLEKQSHYLAAQIWSRDNSMPESVGQMLLALTPEEQQYLMSREMELRTNLNVKETLTHAGLVLAALPPAQQQQALIHAAESLLDQQKQLLMQQSHDQ